MSNFCGTCGAQRRQPDQAFCQQCGSALAGAPPASVPASAPPAPTMQPAPPAQTYQYVEPAGTADYAAPAGLPPRAGSGLPVARTLGVGVAVLALVGAGLVGWQVFGPQGGADSPEQAVQQFVDAAAKQDVVGALDMVNPAEVAGIDDLYAAARDRLADEDLTSEGGDLTEALSVSVTDLDLEAEDAGDSAARVVLRSGSYEVSYDPDKVPDRLGFVTDSYPDAKTWSGDLVEDLGYDFPDANWENERPDPYLMTVKVDGSWYVTAVGMFFDTYLGYSYYEDSGIRPPDYDAADDASDPVVAGEPEDVLDNLADAARSGDVDELLANFPGDEVAALRPYATTFEDLLADDGLSFDVSLDGVKTSSDEVGGDLVRLTIEEGSVFGAYTDEDGDSGSGSASVRGRCASAVDDEYGDEGSFCIEGDVASKTGIDSYYLMLRKVDGGYQVDPIATAVDYARTVIESAPSSLVDDALDEIEQEVG